MKKIGILSALVAIAVIMLSVSIAAKEQCACSAEMQAKIQVMEKTLADMKAMCTAGSSEPVETEMPTVETEISTIAGTEIPTIAGAECPEEPGCMNICLEATPLECEKACKPGGADVGYAEQTKEECVKGCTDGINQKCKNSCYPKPKVDMESKCAETVSRECGKKCANYNSQDGGKTDAGVVCLDNCMNEGLAECPKVCPVPASCQDKCVWTRQYGCYDECTDKPDQSACITACNNEDTKAKSAQWEAECEKECSGQSAKKVEGNWLTRLFTGGFFWGR